MHPGQTATGEGGIARDDEGDLPRLCRLSMQLNVAKIHMKGCINGIQKVIGKIFLEHITFAVVADDEVIDAVVAVNIEDVSQDRLTADLHHRLGPQVGFPCQSRTQSAGEDHGFHIL